MAEIQLQDKPRQELILDLAEKRVSNPIDVEDVIRFINLYKFAYGVKPHKVVVSRDQYNSLKEDFRIWKNVMFGKCDLEETFKQVDDVILEVKI